ncbi:MAG TPA: Kdo hydroxylase family protein [Gammaproteobacteria bacterium]|nr:Kdo hydroxylase family protein [Gammaproteobacteria bacterium]
MKIMQTLDNTQWDSEYTPETQQQALSALEAGQLLFFPRLAFELNASEMSFLSPDFVEAKAKNISYNTHTNTIKGAIGTAEQREQIKNMLARFSQQTYLLINRVFPHYQGALQIGRTSFRPVQVSNRKMSYRKDDRLLHVDAFPANPNQGRRILRVFSNINPHGEDRVWRIGEPFESVAARFLPAISRPLPGSNKLLQQLKLTKSLRTEYDHIMLQLHNRMKKDTAYQHQVMQTELRLPPGASWVVQTDSVSHAALSGQHMLEQTFYLPVPAMANRELSPLKILERLTGRALV